MATACLSQEAPTFIHVHITAKTTEPPQSAGTLAAGGRGVAYSPGIFLLRMVACPRFSSQCTTAPRAMLLQDGENAKPLSISLCIFQIYKKGGDLFA